MVEVACPSGNAWKRLSLPNGRPFFEVVVAGDEVRRPKPEPEGMKKILASFERANVLYVGDHKADIEIGKRCGIQTMLISEFNKTLESALNWGLKNFVFLYRQEITLVEMAEAGQ